MSGSGFGGSKVTCLLGGLQVGEFKLTGGKFRGAIEVPWFEPPGETKVKCGAGSAGFTVLPRYQVLDISVPGATNTVPEWINNSGQVTGYYTDPAAGGVKVAFLLSARTRTDLRAKYSRYADQLGTGLAHWLNPLSNSGYQYFYGDAPSVFGQQDGYPSRWTNGQWAHLPLPQGFTQGTAIGVANGNVIGYAGNGQSEPYGATYWDWMSGAVHLLPDLPNATQSVAQAVNRNDLVVGISDFQGGAQHATAWPNFGTPVDLGTLGGTLSAARAVNDDGEIGGTASRSGDKVFDAVLWYNGKPTNLGTLGGSSAAVNSLNAAWTGAGTSFLRGDSVFDAFVENHGGMFDLNKYVGSGFKGRLEVATHVNSLEQIAAWGSDPAAAGKRGFVLSPVGVLAQGTVGDTGFSPAVLTTHVGGTAVWINLGPGAHTVTDSTGMRLFDSGQMEPTGSATYRFFGAGTYPLVDMQDPTHTGHVRVPLDLAPRAGHVGAAAQLYWGSRPAPKGFRYVVQFEPPGASSFKPFYSGSQPEKGFIPLVPGTFTFRGRVEISGTHHQSEWSPLVQFSASGG